MAQLQARQHFRYDNVQISKTQSLGIGSYGAVYKSKCGVLPCAAKILHPTLFQTNDPGATKLMQRFEQECEFLSDIRHPNIVQYLGTFRDPDMGLPVLLMELMDESLTHFLEQTQDPLPYHVQVNLSHDIALALAYLHMNDIIHRDLSSNNVLLIAGNRAKVTDFGMSKLANTNPRMSSLTLCPGTTGYMPPEALKEPPVYTKKLDCFSHGVVAIQVMTRQFPNPGPPMKEVDFPASPVGKIHMPVPDAERRKSHIDLIDPTHPLLLLALSCLSYKEEERPSSEVLCHRLTDLKETLRYEESVQQRTLGTAESVHALTEQIADLQQNLDQTTQQLQAKEQDLDHSTQQLQAKEQELDHSTQQLQAKEQELDHSTQQLQAKEQELDHLIQQLQTKEQLLQEAQTSLEAKEQQLKANEEIVASFQQSIVQKEEMVIAKEEEIRQLQKQLEKLGQAHVTGRPSVGTGLRLSWRESECHCSSKLSLYSNRGPAVDGKTVYFTGYSKEVVVYDSEGKTWSELPKCPYKGFALVIIRGKLTTIGGRQDEYSEPTNTLLSLSSGKWVESFPAMPTKRHSVAAMCTTESLIIAGGKDKYHMKTVEVMDITSQQWSTASSLPIAISRSCITVSGDVVYLMGGFVSSDCYRLVLMCSLAALLNSCHSQSVQTEVWQSVADAPGVNYSACATVKGHLLAFGGEDSLEKATTGVHMYDPHSDSWCLVSNMPKPVGRSHVAVLPGNRVLVVERGGPVQIGTVMD